MVDLLTKLNVFSDYTFDADTHTYWWKGEKVSTSVTQFIERYTEPFNRDYWARKAADKRGVSVDAIVHEWEEKGRVSATAGTQIHLYLQNKLCGKCLDVTTGDSIVDEKILSTTPLCDSFVTDVRHGLIPVKSEFIVGQGTRIAGQLDQLFYNTYSNAYEVWDWKTNKSIDTDSNYNKYMLAPFEHLKDCNFNSYCVQLECYRYFLSQVGLDMGTSHIVWFSSTNDHYKVFDCHNFQKQLKILLYNKVV